MAASPGSSGEAVVGARRGRGEDPAARDRLGERALEGEAPRELGGERLRQVATAGECERLASRGPRRPLNEPPSASPAALRDRLERLLARERLREQRGDLREAALHAGLPRALGEDLRVPERERRQVRERLQQRELAFREGARLLRTDAEHAADAAADDDRRVHHLGEASVRGARRRLLGLGEAAPQHRPSALEGFAERSFGCDATADLRVGQAVDGTAAEGAVVVVEDPAVGGVGADQADGFGDETLEDAIRIQILGEHLCGLEQGGLLVEASAVLLEQPARVDRETDLLGDRLDERDLVGRPATRLAALGGKHADDAIADDHGRGDGGPRAERDEVLAPLERALGLEIVDRDRSTFGGGELGHRQALRGRGRGETLAPPLAQDLGRAMLVDDPDEATVGSDGRRGLGRRRVEQRLGVEVRAEALQEPGEQPLALERVRERRHLRPLLLAVRQAGEQAPTLAEAREVEDGRKRADDRRGEREPAAASDRLAVDEDGEPRSTAAMPTAGKISASVSSSVRSRPRPRQAAGTSVAAASR